MDVTTDAREVAGMIAHAIRAEFVETDDSFEFMSTLQPDLFEGRDEPVAITTRFTKLYLGELFDSLRDRDVRDETVLVGPNDYEVLVQEQSLRFGPRRFIQDGAFVQQDPVSEITFCMDRASDRYILFLLLSLRDETAIRSVWRFHKGYRPDIEVTDSVFEVLRRHAPRMLTLRLESVKERSSSELSRYADALLFQICYNLDLSLVPQRFLDELLRTGRLARIRRSRLEDIDPPRRHYIPDLVHHYQQGVANDSPPMEFLSYYHVAEHFFESIFSDDLVERVQDIITGAGFSYRRSRDVRSLIAEVERRLKIRGDTVTFSEPEALRLTILKFVDTVELASTIASYDSGLLQYYKTTDVSFSNGMRVDVASENVDQVATHLSRRIYSTRNSIVHSKEGEMKRYIPFKHDRELSKEVPLMRFIAESIINGSSTVP